MKKMLIVLSGLCVSSLFVSCCTTSPTPKGAGSFEEIKKVALTGDGSLRAQYTDWSTLPISEVAAMKKEMLKFKKPFSSKAQTSIVTIVEFEEMQAKTWIQWSWNIRPQKVILVKDFVDENGFLQFQYGVFEKEGKWYFSKGYVKEKSESGPRD